MWGKTCGKKQWRTRPNHKVIGKLGQEAFSGRSKKIDNSEISVGREIVWGISKAWKLVQKAPDNVGAFKRICFGPCLWYHGFS